MPDVEVAKSHTETPKRHVSLKNNEIPNMQNFIGEDIYKLFIYDTSTSNRKCLSNKENTVLEVPGRNETGPDHKNIIFECTIPNQI